MAVQPVYPIAGRSQDFSKVGGGGVGGGRGDTVSNIIVIAFSPRNIVGCLLKKGLQRGGHGHPMPGPSSVRPCIESDCCWIFVLYFGRKISKGPRTIMLQIYVGSARDLSAKKKNRIQKLQG